MVEAIHTHGAHFNAHAHRAHSRCVLRVELDRKPQPPGRHQQRVCLPDGESRWITENVHKLSSLALLYLHQEMISNPLDVLIQRSRKLRRRRVRRHEGRRDVDAGFRKVRYRAQDLQLTGFIQPISALDLNRRGPMPQKCLKRLLCLMFQRQRRGSTYSNT